MFVDVLGRLWAQAVRFFSRSGMLWRAYELLKQAWLSLRGKRG